MCKFTNQASIRLRYFLCVFCAFMLAISAQADTFYVSISGNDSNDGSQARPWRTIRKAGSTVTAGSHTIMVAVGTYEETSASLQPGVSLQGAGIDKTVIRVSVWLWNEGAIRLISGKMTSGNQTLKGFTLDGKNHTGWSGIQVINRSDITIADVKIQYFFDNAVGLSADYGTVARNIEIANFEIRESSRESGNSSQGNITTRGNIDNMRIHDGIIYHETNVPVGPWGEKSSGYAIKCFASWAGNDFSNTDLISNSKIYNIKDVGKSSAAWGSGVPNIGFEFWRVGASEVEIYNCDMSTQISLEYDDATPYAKGKYCFWVHDNRFKVITGASIELAVSNTIIENNTFDYRDNVNGWNVMGEYNQRPQGGASNIHVRRNYFILGNRSPIIWALNNASDRIYFYNNTITGDGDYMFPPIFQMRTPHSGRTSSNMQVLNNVFDVGTGNSIDYCIYDQGVGQPTNTVLKNNHHSKLFKGIPNGTLMSGNRQIAPAIRRSGSYPLPYLEPIPGGALIDAGTTELPNAPIPMSFSGNAPDIGAFESGQTAAPVPVNKNPAVGIASPTNNAAFVEASSLTINVSATDADGTVAKVEFYADNVKIGEKTSAPWTLDWSNLKVGIFSLTAKATDNQSGTATSAEVKITVNAKPVAVTPPAPTPQPNQNPAINITAPTNNAVFTEGASVTLTANASDADGTVTKVEFYANNVKIGEKATAPWTFAWNNVAKGSYSVTAKAIDNQNAATISSAITVVVEAKPIAISAPTTSPVASPIVSPLPSAPSGLVFYRAVNLNGPALRLDGNDWGGHNTPNYTYSGTPFANQGVRLNPTTDDVRASMIRSSVYGRNVSVSLTAVPAATYEVYVYVWEDNYSETFTLFLEGKAVQTNYVSGGAGAWKRLGPFRTALTDGAVSLATTGGDANLSGVEVWQVPTLNSRSVTTCFATGYILRETWDNVPIEVSAMVPAFRKPTASSQLTVFESPTNMADNYRSRIRGYICPPMDGDYTFWISGDAQCELWFSSDENPAGKSKIAFSAAATNPREWNKSKTQQSATIRLERGKKYYIEAVHKAGIGNDHLAVGWQMPDKTREMPISGVRLAPFVATEGEFTQPALAENKLVLFPNPANDRVNIRFNVNEAQDATIIVTSLTAQQIIAVVESATAGENIIPLEIGSLGKGMYIVQVQTKQGRISQKLLIAR